MSFNFGSFNESLKYTFQQFSKQEAEARENSRQLLLRLDRFEAKALELGARSKKALQIKNHYERMLMHQHPLVWAHIQRGLVFNIADLEIPAGFSETLPMRSTKEMAINTSLSSSPSDQNSLHEAVWPNSPSPYPDETTEKLPPVKGPVTRQERETLTVTEDIPEMEKLNITKILEAPENEEGGKTKLIESSYHNFLNHKEKEEETTARYVEEHRLSHQLVNNESPLRNSQHTEQVPEKKFQQRSEPHERSPSPDQSHDRQNQSLLVPSSLQVKPLNSEPIPSSLEEVSIQDHQDDQVAHPSSKESKDLKTFRLDSESDCPDDPISGPSAGQAGEGDDSDSFWG